MTNKITYKEFIQLVDSTYNCFEWRYGQTVMNVLHSIDLKKYNQLLNTENDCYYDDNKVQGTLKLIQEWIQNASM